MERVLVFSDQGLYLRGRTFLPNFERIRCHFEDGRPIDINPPLLSSHQDEGHRGQRHIQFHRFLREREISCDLLNLDRLILTSIDEDSGNVFEAGTVSF